MSPQGYRAEAKSAQPFTGITATDVDWMLQAKCRGTSNPDQWFPEQGAGNSDGTARRARQLCVGCPVRDECLAYALRYDIGDGIWGALSPRGRRELGAEGRRAIVERGGRG